MSSLVVRVSRDMFRARLLARDVLFHASAKHVSANSDHHSAAVKEPKFGSAHHSAHAPPLSSAHTAQLSSKLSSAHAQLSSRSSAQLTAQLSAQLSSRAQLSAQLYSAQRCPVSTPRRWLGKWDAFSSADRWSCR